MPSDVSAIAARLRQVADSLHHLDQTPSHGTVANNNHDTGGARETSLAFTEATLSSSLRAACREVQATSGECWDIRPLPHCCRRLLDLMASPAREGQVQVDLATPRFESAAVAIITCQGVAEAVVKRRGQAAQKAVREECHYLLSEVLGTDSVAAPCVAMELPLPQRLGELDSDRSKGGSVGPAGEDSGVATVGRLVAHRFAEKLTADEGACPLSVWVTVETCIRVAAAPTGLSLRLCNRYGCCDLETAWRATPAWRAHGPPLLRDNGVDKMSDADLCSVVSRLSPARVHMLCALACIVLQRDGGAPNLMLRQLAAGNENGEGEVYAAVTIDATRVFGTCPNNALRLTEEDDDSTFLAYWYPACLALPQAAELFDAEVAARILSVDLSATRDLVSGVLGSAPGASQHRCDADAHAVTERLRQLQSLLRHRGSELSVRECCFAVVPSWGHDWAAAVAGNDLGPLPQLEAHLRSGAGSEEWGYQCARKRPIGITDSNGRSPLVCIATAVSVALFVCFYASRQWQTSLSLHAVAFMGKDFWSEAYENEFRDSTVDHLGLGVDLTLSEAVILGCCIVLALVIACAFGCGWRRSRGKTSRAVIILCATCWLRLSLWAAWSSCGALVTHHGMPPSVAELDGSAYHDAFFWRHKSLGQPAVVRGLIDEFVTGGAFRPEALATESGLQRRNVSLQFGNMEQYDAQPEATVQFPTFAAHLDDPAWLADLMAAAGAFDPPYLSEVMELWDDMPELRATATKMSDSVLGGDARAMAETRLLWIGPAGTLTGLHLDSEPFNLLFQVHGNKTLYLIPPSDIWRLYPSDKYDNGAVNFRLDPFNPDLEAFPLYANVAPLVVTVRAGDVLFVPYYWPHFAKSESTSVSVSVRRFSACEVAARVPGFTLGILHRLGLYKSRETCACHVGRRKAARAL